MNERAKKVADMVISTTKLNLVWDLTQEFKTLKRFSDADYSCSEAKKDINRRKNRYRDILPFDYTRVALSEYPDEPGSDYINANYIKGASGNNAYIACQGPLPHTICDFWRMVVECEVQVIVMACNEQEAGVRKCEKYWRDVTDEICIENTSTTANQPSATFGKYEVTLMESKEICPDFVKRTMRLRWKISEGSDSSEEYEERTVSHFQYTAWPDHGIPKDVKPVLEMIGLIRDSKTSETSPILIHCSAGVGRTGTICAIDYICCLLRSGRLNEKFSLHSLVCELRKQRMGMIQTADQYALVHSAIKELYEKVTTREC